MTETVNKPKSNIALYALTIGAFGIGTTEFVIMGLLMQVSQDFQVSLSAAGMLITGYALGVVVGAPLLTAFAGKYSRKNILITLMGIFTLGNLLCAIAPTYELLMAARIITSLSHGAFFGIGAVVATTLVTKDKKSSAIAIMFTGLTAANVLGVPFGTWLGQMHGWRATFWAVTAIGPLAMAGLALYLPKDKAQTPARIADELKVLTKMPVVLAFLTTVLGFGGVFTVFTYIAPILTKITLFGDNALSLILVLFGVGLVIGNLLGGKFADKNVMRTLIGSLVALAITLFAMSFLIHNQIATVVLVVLLGIFGFATVPALQMRVLQKASGAPALGSAFNIAAFNLGNALGAWAGGVVIDQGPGLQAVPTAAGIVALFGIGAALWSVSLDR